MIETADPPIKPRILVVAVACSPKRGSEGAMGWNRALQAARFYETWVVTEEGELGQEIRDYLQKHGPIPNLHFSFVPNGRIGGFLRKFRLTYYLSYHLWHRCAFQVMKQLHAKHHFSLVHQATYCGFREPGFGWKVAAPFVWGPVGGTQDFPWKFLSTASTLGAISEVFRMALNQIQLRFGIAARRTIRQSATVLAANTSIRSDFETFFGVSPEVRLESGINTIATTRRNSPDPKRPIRLLWSGELRTRKALPLLLDALPHLPGRTDFQLKVLGKGPEQARWMRIANERGIASKTEFLGFLPRSEALGVLDWADIFVFTSLRDTSGTVVLEAISQGIPVVCLDHQGVRDIVTDQCGIKVAVSTPKQVAKDISEAIDQLAHSPDRYESLSDGALMRAREYLWDAHGDHMASVYRRIIESNSSTNRKTVL